VAEPARLRCRTALMSFVGRLHHHSHGPDEHIPHGLMA
jgi:hypothetical protein